MPVLKDDSIALRKYYPIANIVILVTFLIANTFVVMQLFNASFLVNWAAQIETYDRVLIKFLKHYPGFYYVFQNLCYPGFWLVNDMPHEFASWLADNLNEIRHSYPQFARDFGINTLHRSIASFARRNPNFVLQFFESKLYVYSIGEIIISASAIVYGLITRFVIKIIYNVFVR